jgi:predicted amidohydrolase
VRPVTVKIACAQLAARPLSQARAALRDILAAIDRAAERGAALVVLPECSYPGYVLMTRQPFRGLPGTDEVLRSVAGKARRLGIAVAVGVARFDAQRRLRNEAVYIDRRGVEIARYAKVFLWSFDSRWFCRGAGVSAFDTEFGRLGMMICADGRAPEIARALRDQGAWLVLDPTAWVGFGASYGQMRNPQADYMMRVRARENGLWLAAAGKCGSERTSVHYVGRSMVVDPLGDVVAVSPPDRPALLLATATQSAAKRFAVSTNGSMRAALRRTRPRARARARVPTPIGILQGPAGKGRREAIDALHVQGAQAVVDTVAPRAGVRALEALRGVSVAHIKGRSMFAPETARACALDGADAIVWTEPPRESLVRECAQTRALENRVFVIVCASSRAPEPACVIAPDGRVVAEAIAGKPSGFMATLDAHISRDKAFAVCTDAFGVREALSPAARAFADRPRRAVRTRTAAGARS